MNGQHGHHANTPIVVNKNNKIIAFAGKGGTGKTSLCGMLIQYLCDSGRKPILAVDADANTNLNEVLGVNIESTMGGLQEELRAAGIHSPVKGISKDIYAELKLNLALTETRGYDLLVIGRPEGRGCYCNVSGILERQLTKIQNYYPYIVVDNEAGMEHISRGILPKIDVLILVSDCSRRGIECAARIAALVNEMEINPKSMGLIVNRAPDGILNDGTMEEIKRHNLNLFGIIGKDDAIYEYDCAGKPLVQIPETSSVKQSIKRIAEELKL